jgi:hypothetical protein
VIQLITPVGLLLTVALLAIYSAYAFMIGTIERSELLIAGGVVAVIASYGTAMMRPWSQYLVYGLAAGFVVKWLHSIYYARSAGYFSFAFSSWTELFRSLAPGLVLVVLSGACSYLVFRHFHKRQQLVRPDHLNETGL